jgi:hypothetical protein
MHNPGRRVEPTLRLTAGLLVTAECCESRDDMCPTAVLLVNVVGKRRAARRGPECEECVRYVSRMSGM